VQPSPLEKYLDTQEDHKGDLDSASQQLLDAVLKVHQNASELASLRERFSAVAESDSQDSILLQLTQSYVKRLSAGLDDETKTLAALGFENQTLPSSNTAAIDVAAEVDRNESLCRELIAGSSESTRPASEIVSEIYKSIARIRLAVAALPRSSK
jgi:hypothetical protein